MTLSLGGRQDTQRRVYVRRLDYTTCFVDDTKLPTSIAGKTGTGGDQLSTRHAIVNPSLPVENNCGAPCFEWQATPRVFPYNVGSPNGASKYPGDSHAY